MTDQEKDQLIQDLQEKVNALEISDQNGTESISEKQKAKTIKQEKLFLVMFITFLASIPVLLVLHYIENQIERVVVLIVVLIFIVFLISFFIIKYKERILKFIFNTTKTQVEEVLEPVPKVIEAYENKDFEVVKKEGMELLKMAYAKYSWVKMRLFILNTTMALFLGFGALLGVFLIFKQNELIVSQTKLLKNQNRQVEAQTQLAESNRRSSLVFLMSNIMDKVDQEIREDTVYRDSLKLPEVKKVRVLLRDRVLYLKRSKIDSLQKFVPKKKLSSQLEGRIIALSNSLKSYRYWQGDSLIEKPLSPERAQLLVSLVESGIQLDNIKKKTSFEKADLIGANLIGADLRSANLSGADLRSVELFGADLRRAYLIGTDLRRAGLRRANLRGANLLVANLRGANLIGVDLREADLNWANLRGANLFWADLRGADLKGVNLRGALLPKTERFNTVRFNNSTKLNDAFTADLKWLKNIDKQIRNDKKKPFNSKKYELSDRLSNKEIKALSKKFKFLENWPENKPLYQIRLKKGEKEE